MIVEFRDLEYFVAVAEELHFGRAARRLYIAQPPLSQRIQRLESQLGYPLFERTSRRVELTEQGAALVDEARSALASRTQLEQDVTAALTGEVGRLRIAFTGSMLFEGLPAALRAFRAGVPGIEIDLVQMPQRDQVTALEGRRIDVGIAWPPPVTRLSVYPLGPIELLAAVPTSRGRRDHATAISLKSLREQPFLVTDDDGADHVMTACRENGFEPQIYQPATEMTSVVGLVGAGLGVALVPRSMSRLTLPNVTFRPLKPQVMAAAPTVMWRADRPSTVLTRFLQIVRPLLSTSDV